MGFGYYTASIKMQGDKKARKKAYSFIESFINDDDKKLAEDPLYKTFKEETEKVWGVRDEDYCGNIYFEISIVGDEDEFSVSFVRGTTRGNISDFYEPLFEAFPEIVFYLYSEGYWYNNAGEQSGPGFMERGKYEDGECVEYVEFDEGRDPSQTADEWLEAISEDASALEEAPSELMTFEFCLEAMRRNGEAFQHIPDAPKEFKTELWFAWLKENPDSLPLVPEEYITIEMCLFAVKQFGGSCANFPPALQTEDNFLEAVKINSNGKALKYVPDKYLTLKVCVAAIQSHPDMADEIMEYVPKALKAEVKSALIPPHGAKKRR